MAITIFEDNSVYEEVTFFKQRRGRKQVRSITADNAEELSLAMQFNACNNHVEMINGRPHRLASSDDSKKIKSGMALVPYKNKFWVPCDTE